MTVKPTIWYPIAVGLSALNLVGAGFALRPGEGWHAAIHVVLALAFGLWARRLRRGRGGSESHTGAAERIGEQLQPQLEALEAEMSRMRQELTETQERLDFTERVLAQEREARRVGPQR